VPESWVINASPVILLAKVGLIQHVPKFNVSAMVNQIAKNGKSKDLVKRVGNL
jgi:hypothetical protein